MLQQINLYAAPPEYNPWREWYPLPQVAIGLVVVLMLLYALAFWQHKGLKGELAEVQQKFDETQQQMESLRLALPPVALDPALEAEVLALGASLAAKQGMLETLNIKQVTNTNGFSIYLEGLARRTIQGLWLTRIELADGGANVGLKGQTAKPEFVPRLIQSLANEGVYGGTEFDVFSISNDQQDGYMDFEVRADLGGDR